LCTACLVSSAAHRFVDASYTGRKSDGTVKHPWSAIQTAIDHGLHPGDTLFVKAGEYGPAGIVLKDSGTPDAPIVIQGYHHHPNYVVERPAASLSSFAEEMPRLCGNYSAEGIAIDLNGQDHVSIRHLAMGNYRVGIRNMRAPKDPSEGLRLEYVLGQHFGEHDNEKYSGWGILLDDENAVVNHCAITDAGAEGIGVYGDGNMLTDCLVLNQDDGLATDYFIVIKGNDNVVQNCVIRQEEFVKAHSGHGIGIKNAHGNRIVNSLSYNTNKGFYASGPDCMQNQFYRCLAYGDVGFVLRDGAHDNMFEECQSIEAEICLRFIESIEYGKQAYIARDNSFVGCVFAMSKTLIELRSSSPAAIAKGNTFESCHFYDAITFIAKTSGLAEERISFRVVS